MLKVISLHTLNEIFSTEAIDKVSPMTRMVYINCLSYHFKNKEANVINCKGFDIHKSEFEYEKSKKRFEELKRAGLVFINEDSITFPNVWSNHIDKSLLSRVDVNEFLALSNHKTIDHYAPILLGDKELIELCAMNNRLQEEQVVTLIKEFVKEQSVLSKMYAGVTEAKRHCMYWVNKKGKGALTKAATQKTKKILGLDQ